MEFRTGCRNVSHEQQSFSGLQSPTWSFPCLLHELITNAECTYWLKQHEKETKIPAKICFFVACFSDGCHQIFNENSFFGDAFGSFLKTFPQNGESRFPVCTIEMFVGENFESSWAFFVMYRIPWIDRKIPAQIQILFLQNFESSWLVFVK